MTKTRIYICGAQSVGKTTLCRELGLYLGYKVINEAARDVMNAEKIDFHKIAVDIDARDQFQLQVVELHLNRHKEAVRDIIEGRLSGGVFDRGIDFLVYAAGFSTVAHDQYEWPDTKKYIDALKSNNALVFLLEPHEHLMKQDGVRGGLNIRSAWEITFGIKVLLEVLDIPYIHIMTPDTMERVKLVANIMGRGPTG